FTVTINAPPVGGTATAFTPTVCSGSGTTITLTGYSGSIQWQKRTGVAAFADISGATTDTLLTGNLTTTTDFRAKVTSGGCTDAFSTTATVTTVACNPANLGTASDTSTGNTLVSATVNVLAGDTIFVAVAMDPSSSSSSVTVGDSAGNSYTKDADVTTGSGTSGVRTLLFSSPVLNTLNGTITVTFGTPVPFDKAASFFYVTDLVSP